MKAHRHVSYTIDNDDFEFEVNHPPATHRDGPCDPIIKQLPDGRFVVGYLSHDDDCENPLDFGDGYGTIHRRYHGSRDSKAAFFDAMGQDEYGHQTHKPNPLGVLLDVYDHSGEHWSIFGGGMQCQWDTTRGAGIWVPNDCVKEHILYTAIQRLLPEGTVVNYESKHNPDGTCITRPPKEGERPYFSDGTCIDERFSNVITYTLPNGEKRGGYKNFVTAIRAAAKKLGVKTNWKTIQAEAYKVAVECAQQALDAYNSWGDGDCWGVCVETFDDMGRQLTDDACWGHVGGKYAEETLELEVKAKVEYLESHPQKEKTDPRQLELFPV